MVKIFGLLPIILSTNAFLIDESIFLNIKTINYWKLKVLNQVWQCQVLFLPRPALPKVIRLGILICKKLFIDQH